MANKITDLTGYTWTANGDGLLNVPSLLPEKDYALTFTCDTTSYHSLGFQFIEDELIDYILKYNDTKVYSFDVDHVWTGQKYRTINIAGGTAATDTDLITWMQDNGALSKPSTASMYLGTTEIEKVYLGSIEIEKIYLGENQIL